MSNILPAENTGIVAITAHLNNLSEHIGTLAAGSLDPARFIAIVVHAVQKTPRLLECEPDSLVLSVMESAALGLIPSGITGEAYLIPRTVKGRLLAQFQLGYKGAVKLALESGSVRAMRARPVYAEDDFDFSFGLESDTFRHVPTQLDEPGKVILAYSIARMAEGPAILEVTVRRDIERARAMAQTDKVWATHYPEQASKTSLFRLCKLLTLSPKFHRALALNHGEVTSGEMGAVLPAGFQIEGGAATTVAVKPQGKAEKAAARFTTSKPKTGDAEPVKGTEPEGTSSGAQGVSVEQESQELADESSPWEGQEESAAEPAGDIAQTEKPEPAQAKGPRKAGQTTITKLHGAAQRAGISAVQMAVLLEQRDATEFSDLTLPVAKALLDSINNGTWEEDTPF